ncbi:MAG: response regulator [bacterium]|nr:response regulator [bacterium]
MKISNGLEQNNTNQNKSGKIGKVILLIEDDALLVKAYEAKFKKEGLNVWIIMNGTEAIKSLEKDPPSLVLLDLMLPGASGFDVLRAIKNNEKWKNIPVVVLTNLGQNQDIERIKEIGEVKEYIIKANMKISDIIEKIKKYLA